MSTSVWTGVEKYFDRYEESLRAKQIDMEMELQQDKRAHMEPEDKKRKRKRIVIPRALVEEAMRDLDGTTAARAKHMSNQERDLVLLKRKLRNRESAKRSNMKRQMEASALQAELSHVTQLLEQELLQLEQFQAARKGLHPETARR
ncbi:hypothetical protein NDN08_000309 [Rhodosorus marinus]|uniref:BZIP domain-containing protein n=1 Tax=Rhodosorus marinus TaxID=101924 RepID=A0AAV8UMI8_9RHOD|nr:hypothetical protein NDN08_000309 [Rhodosorus marinus]